MENKDKILKLPVNTFREFMTSKGIDYGTYCTILLFSKFQNCYDNEDKSYDGCYDSHRYIYKKEGEGSIYANAEKIEELSKKKIDTIIRNINKIVKVSDNKMMSVQVIKKNKQIVYIIPKGNNYVQVEEDILKVICQLGNNAIKTYMFLKWRLKDGKEIVTRKEIANNIGLCTDSEKNLSVVTDILKILISLRLIKKTIISNFSKEGKEYNSDVILELIPYEEWIIYWNKIGKGIK